MISDLDPGKPSTDPLSYADAALIIEAAERLEWESVQLRRMADDRRRAASRSAALLLMSALAFALVAVLSFYGLRSDPFPAAPALAASISMLGIGIALSLIILGGASGRRPRLILGFDRSAEALDRDAKFRERLALELVREVRETVDIWAMKEAWPRAQHRSIVIRLERFGLSVRDWPGDYGVDQPDRF